MRRSDNVASDGEGLMGLLDRIRNIVRANVHDSLDRAEDPVKSLDLMIADWSSALVSVRQATSLAIAAQTRLKPPCARPNLPPMLALRLR